MQQTVIQIAKDHHMKTINILLLALIILSGCKKDQLQLFEEETPLLNIWLGSTLIVQDSLTHNFAFSPTNRDAITFNYRIAGYPVNYDRTFELSTSDKDATLLNFTFGSYKVPAGQYEGSFTFYVDKPTDERIFNSGDLRVSFKVKETNQFQSSANEYNRLKIKFKSAVTKPDNWETDIPTNYPLKNYFGAYSDRKYRFIIQTTGLQNFSVSRLNTVNPTLPENTIVHFHAIALKNQCRVALEQYNADHDPDWLDENGNAIVFPL